MIFQKAPWIGALLVVSLLDARTGRSEEAAPRPTPLAEDARANPAPAEILARPTADEPLDMRAPPRLKKKRGIKWIPSAIVTGGLIGLSAAVVPKAPDQPRWTGAILADNAFRQWLEVAPGQTRQAIATASDIGLFTNTITPLATYGILALAAPQFRNVAYINRAMIGAQAFLGNLVVTTALKALVARQRPTADYGNESFPSGHASTAFTGAFLLLGDASPFAGDDLKTVRYAVGGTALAIATTTAAFRISAGRHYFSDVFVGASLGFFFGYVYPLLLGNGEENEIDPPTTAFIDPLHVDGPMLSLRFSF